MIFFNKRLLNNKKIPKRMLLVMLSIIIWWRNCENKMPILCCFQLWQSLLWSLRLPRLARGMQDILSNEDNYLKTAVSLHIRPNKNAWNSGHPTRKMIYLRHCDELCDASTLQYIHSKVYSLRVRTGDTNPNV